MRHYGNIANIKLSKEDIVDVVIGGSPCQGLSVAGKRAGLNDERSGLFMEQIRITKEMRELDKRINGRTGESVRPRYGIWENVPGALSSGTPKGEDFRIVLEEFCRIADPEVRIPSYPAGGWPSSGIIVADEWSVAWRILDNQYWGKTIRDRDTGNLLQMGAPQRRRRIALVADFGGTSAGKILFESESMCGDYRQSEEAREGTTDDAQGSVGGNSSVRCLNPWDIQSHRIYDSDGSFASLYSAGTSGAQNCGVLIENAEECACGFLGKNGSKAFSIGYSVESTPTLRCTQIPDVVIPINEQIVTRHKAIGKGTGLGIGKENDPAFTIQAAHPHAVCYANVFRSGSCAHFVEGEFGTLKKSGGDCGGRSETLVVCQKHDQQSLVFDMTHANDVKRKYKDICPTLQHRMGTVGNQIPIKVDETQEPRKYVVRRITPLECSRLQGLPDCDGGWCNVPPQETVTDEELSFWKPLWDDWCAINGVKPKTDNQIIKWLKKPISESAQYEMYGNGIARPPWQFVCGRVSRQYDEAPTMCSLFDGTGSFPLIWESINGKGTAVWSSEVNPDAVRVSKYRIG